MGTSGKGEIRPGCYGILANFQFYVDENAENICEGITLNISEKGFSFLTDTEIRQGQTITVTKHALRGHSRAKAKVAWVMKGRRYVEAGANFCPGS